MGKRELVRLMFPDRDHEYAEIGAIPVPGDGTLVWRGKKTWTVTAVVHDWDSTAQTTITIYLKPAKPPWRGCTQGFFRRARHLDMRGIAETHEQAAAIFGFGGDEPFTFEEVHLVFADRCLAYAFTEPQIARLLAAGATPLAGSDS